MLNNEEAKGLAEDIATVLAKYIEAWAARQKRNSDYYRVKTKEINWDAVIFTMNNEIRSSNVDDILSKKLKLAGLDVSHSWD